MEFWQIITTAIIGNASVMLVISWLGKSLLEKLIQRDSKRFEIEIKAKADTAIENLKTELQIRTIEHQVSFSGLHQRRATVIAEINGLLAELLWEAESLLSPMRWTGGVSEQEMSVSAEAKLIEFFRHFDKNRIYLPPEICKNIEDMVLEIRQHVIMFSTYLTWDEKTLPDHTRKEKYETLQAGYKLLKEKVPTLRESLENEFRILLSPSP